MRRLLLILATLLVLTLIVVPGALIWSVVFTEPGLQFLVKHIPHQLADTRLEIVGIRGTIAGGLAVDRVEIDHPLVHLKFEGIVGRVALAPLVLQTIHVLDGSVRSALIEPKRRTKPATSHEPPVFLPRWLMIRVDEAQVVTATLVAYNGFRLRAANLQGSAVIRYKTIRFFEAEGRLGETQVSGIGLLRAHDPLGIEANGRLEWSPPGEPRWRVSGTARGDLDDLNVVAQATSPFRAEFTGKALDLTSHWHLVGQTLIEDFDLAAWGLAGPLGSIRGHLSVSGNIDGFNARGQLNPTGLHAGPFDTEFSGLYADNVLSLKNAEARHLASGTRATASGTVGVVPHGPRLDLTGSWSELRWPLVGREVAFRSPAGAFTLAGILPYQVHFTGSATTAELPVMPLDVTGTLDKDRFSFDPAEVDLFNGHAHLSGFLAWAPEKTWSVAGRVTGINPAALRADLPGKLNVTLALSGRGFESKGDLRASFSDLSGTLRGVPASGGGTLTHSGNTWGFSGVRVALGSATLTLDGRLNERMDLRFAFSAADLNVLSPGSRGRLKAGGTIAGTFEDPEIVATAHGSGIDYQGIKVETIDLDADFDPGDPERVSKIDLQVHGVSHGKRTLESAIFTLRGPPAAYNVHFNAAATGLAVDAHAKGSYARGLFAGVLSALNVNGSESLHLSLERPVEFSAALDHARIEWLCLSGSPGSACADGDWTEALWSGTLMVNEVPLETLTAGMTPAVDYRGTISLLAHMSGGAERPVQGTVRAELADAELLHKTASRKVEHTKIGSGTLNLTATPDEVTASALIGEGGIGTLRGNLALARTTPAWLDMPLTGELHMDTGEASLVSLYVPDIDRAQGHLKADVEVSGTLGAPVLAGLIKVSDGEIDVYQINLALRQLAVEARLSDAGVDFTGSARAGNGNVAVTGHLEWRELEPYGKFHLQGTNLRVADVPEAQIDASPDLDFTVEGKKIDVSGKVTLPYAKIQPKDITSAVRTSADEVIVGQEEEASTKRFEVTSTITLVLGDQVNFDSLGLTARLIGSLTIKSGYDALTRGTGELSVAEGKYTAYARKLDIQRGRLIFTGGPIDDPGIDLRAIKTFPDVTAGVNVRGTLLRPRISFFSDPPLPQSQIVSLILAGGSLESAQRSSAGPGGGAGSAALAQGGAILAQQLGSHVGVEDVSLESDIGNESSLVLGRYLSPRLYVSYGISLTQQLNTFKARYTLGDHWTVRIEMGQAYGADLVYAIEPK